VGCDETNTQFVPEVKRTICGKGVKRVRIVGIGKEKAQVTVTFGGAASGDMLPLTQVIFGGKTVRCHPNGGRTAPPEGLYYEHTKSHWQNEATYLTYVTRVIVPYRLETIKRMGLPANQKLILIHDLHFSHKSVELRDYCTANDIILIFIPAGCTDIMQMCDRVLNKSYKNAVSKAFVQYVAKKFVDHSESGSTDVFSLNMALSVMKPLLPSFVCAGMTALKTPAMKDVIRNCFLKDGLVALARTPEALANARLLFALLPVDEFIEEGNEPEPADLGPVADNDDADGNQDFIIQLDDADTSDNVDDSGEPSVAQATSIAVVPTVAQATSIAVVDHTIPTVAPPPMVLTINVNDTNNNITINSNCVLNDNHESHARVRKGNSMLGSVKKGKYSI
jgi:hypothetical protein